MITNKNKETMARRKSVNDIMNQANRIMGSGGRLTNRRRDAAREIAFRYYGNIRVRGGHFNTNDDRYFDKKYARSTYMGLNAG